MSSTPVVTEPLVFFRDSTFGVSLLVNPDLWLFFLRVARQFGLEGLVAKRPDSRYESGRRK
jgi:hypothetical protein